MEWLVFVRSSELFVVPSFALWWGEVSIARVNNITLVIIVGRDNYYLVQKYVMVLEGVAHLIWSPIHLSIH